MSSNKMATKADLQEMYSRILPYLGGSADAGFTPVGTIISVMGVTAPANYLACNGQVVNIADYPELANYFYQQFGSKNKFGGDGTTTFGIPDLRGEFLRGTGTNAHTNQGNGAAVGTHQNGTIIPNIQSPSGGDYYISGYTSTSAYPVPGEFDYVLKTAQGASNNKISVKLTKSTDSNQLAIKFTARPTNTSVLYCIATKNIYMNPSLDYSTDEKVVGSWIDGNTVYQRTVTIPSDVVLNNSAESKLLNISIPNFSDFIDYKLHQYNVNNGKYQNTPYFRINYDFTEDSLAVSDVVYWSGGGFTIKAGTKITIRYTKTTS